MSEINWREEQEQISLSGIPSTADVADKFLTHHQTNKRIITDLAQDVIIINLLNKTLHFNWLEKLSNQCELEAANLSDSKVSNRADALNAIGQQAMINSEQEKKKGFLGLFG